MDISNIRKTNLIILIDKFGSQKQFSIAVDTAASYFSQIITGTIGKNGKPVNLGAAVARKIEKKLNLEHGYMDRLHDEDLIQDKFLIDNQTQPTYNDNPSRTSNSNQLNSKSRLDNNVAPITTKLLPVLSWVQAGMMTAMEPVDLTDVLDWQPPLSLDDPEGCYYLKVVGVSNSPDYMEGDYILVDPNIYISDLISGDLIVVRDNTNATFKKLIIESDQRKYLQALNPDWKPNIIEFEDGMVLVGLVIDASRPLGGSRRKRVRKI